MPMQPRPRAETSRSPRLRFFICVPFAVEVRRPFGFPVRGSNNLEQPKTSSALEVKVSGPPRNRQPGQLFRRERDRGSFGAAFTEEQQRNGTDYNYQVAASR